MHEQTKQTVSPKWVHMVACHPTASKQTFHFILKETLSALHKLSWLWQARGATKQFVLFAIEDIAGLIILKRTYLHWPRAENYRHTLAYMCTHTHTHRRLDKKKLYYQGFLPCPRGIMQSACVYQVCSRAQFEAETAIVAKENVE